MNEKSLVEFEVDTKSPDAWVDYTLKVRPVETLPPVARAELAYWLRHVAAKIDRGEYGETPDPDQPGRCGEEKR